MSYSLEISFKNCKCKDIYRNLCEFNKLLFDNAEEYISQFLYYLNIDEQKDKEFNRKKVDDLISTIYKVHVWYCNDIKALCFVWNDNIESISKWFDGKICFQDSCDQDYKYDTWNFNDTFKHISDKIRDMNLKDFEKYFFIKNKNYEDHDLNFSDENCLDYWKKSQVYDECYDLIYPIWNNGFAISPFDGALLENKIYLKNLTIKLFTEKYPSFKNCF